jgi:hypothetical protein
MTVETKTREVLLRAADDIEVEPPPLEALLGTAARRRRKIAVVAASLSAAAVVAAVAIVGPGPRESSAPTTAPPPTSAPVTQRVGMDGVMLSVPAEWERTSAVCPSADAQVVMVTPQSMSAECLLGEPAERTRLHMADARETPPALAIAQKATEPVMIGDVVAYREPAENPRSCSSPQHDGKVPCDAIHDGILYVPSRGVVFWISSSQQGLVGQILGSASLIPDGYVAIPANATANELRAMGLAVDARGVEADQAAWTDPSAGAVVPLGSTVAVGPAIEGPIADPTPAVAIVDAHTGCGRTGGFELDVTLATDRRFDVLVLMLARGDIVGKTPTAIKPGRLNHVVVTQAQPAMSREVTAQVVGLGLSMDESTLAELSHIPRTPPPGVICS